MPADRFRRTSDGHRQVPFQSPRTTDREYLRPILPPDLQGDLLDDIKTGIFRITKTAEIECSGGYWVLSRDLPSMENVFASQLLSESSQALEGLPDTLRMQLGPFNPQVQDSKTLSIHSLHASAFRLRYGNSYPRFPAHLIQHLQPQLFPTTVDQRLHFAPGAFRPFNVPTTQNKLFPSAFAPPLKSETNTHESIQELSAGSYVSGYYGSEMEDDSSFRSASEREVDFSCGEQGSKLELSRSTSASTPSPQSSSLKEEKVEGCNGKVPESPDVESSESRGVRRGKMPLDPTSCPICGIMVLLGEAESHFFKELEKLSHISAITRERKYLYDKYNDVQPCFPGFGTSGIEENGHSAEMGIPRGRWETYQRIKSNRLSRLRIKNRKKKNGDPVCPVCNEKIQGSVEDINLHVEHCLKKHSDEAEEDEEENIDVEGDSEVYGEYEWTAGLLTTATSSNHRTCEKDESIPDGDDSSCVTPVQLSDSDAMDEDAGKERGSKARDKSSSVNHNNEINFSKNQIVKSANRV